MLAGRHFHFERRVKFVCQAYDLGKELLGCTAKSFLNFLQLRWKRSEADLFFPMEKLPASFTDFFNGHEYGMWIAELGRVPPRGNKVIGNR